MTDTTVSASQHAFINPLNDITSIQFSLGLLGVGAILAARLAVPWTEECLTSSIVAGHSRDFHVAAKRRLRVSLLRDIASAVVAMAIDNRKSSTRTGASSSASK